MGKFGEMAKAADWQGRRVRLRAAFTARTGALLPVGTEMEVIRAYGGLKLGKVHTCPLCGCGPREIIDRVPYNQVYLVARKDDKSFEKH